MGGLNRFEQLVQVSESLQDSVDRFQPGIKPQFAPQTPTGLASAWTFPNGASRIPSGPTSPATSTSLKDASTARLANSTPAWLIDSHLALQVMSGEFKAIRAECIGLDDLRASLDIFLVNFSHHGWVAQVERIETLHQIQPRAD